MTVKPGTMPTGTGEGYEILMGRWSRILSGPFLDFIGLADGSRVLDAGCGTGALSAEIVWRTESAMVTGIDLAPAYIDYAANTVSNPRASFEVGDLTALSFADGSFDAIVSNLVLHFVPKVDDAIAEMIRVAKPGAVVAANVWDPRSGFIANKMFLDTAAVLDPKAAELRKQVAIRPLSRPGELTSAWTAAGFRDVQGAELHIRMEFQSYDDYWAPYDSMDGPAAAYLRSTTPELRQRVKEAVRAAYLDGDTDGFRSYTATAFAVKGIKED